MGGENTDDEGITAQLRADYTIPSQANPTVGLPRHYNQDFVIKTRELNPNGDADGDDGSTPLQGSDVAMLEAMLWQFGISPQHAFPGSGGDRLGDRSASLQGIIGGVEGTAGRHRFSSGMSGPDGSGSLERMVKRFKNRSFERTEDGIKGISSSQTAAVDDQTLAQLSRVWSPYWSAVRAIPQARFRFADLNTDYWDALSEAASGTVNFVEPERVTSIPWNYDDSVHASAMRAVGNSEVTRAALLRAWVSKENNIHWGANNTDYRISEGRADEVGSIGFSQIWFAYMYGQRAGCDLLNGVNMYHPRNNLLGFAVWAGDPGCGGSMHLAFNTDRYTVPNDPDTDSRLAGYQCTHNNDGSANDSGICAYTPDEYERLIKGLVGYNVGASAARLLSCSLPEMLAGDVTRQNKASSDANSTLSCQATRESGKQLDYGLTILHGTFPQTSPPDTLSLSLPYRQFVWIGGQHDYQRDPHTGVIIRDEENEPIPHPQQGEDWCFGYGAEEWRRGVSFNDAWGLAADESEDGLPQVPVGRVNC